MPVEIWTAAVTLAREFGVCRIARALSIDYSALRKRTEMVRVPTVSVRETAC
ncbi:MAG: hypothetical protein ABSH53_20940 [Holophaga sp.]|jgi:hypothetical protein